MKRYFVIIIWAVGLAGCKSGDKTEKKFTVSGTITNVPDRMLYLSEIPMATMKRTIVDSVRPGKDGKFELKGKSNEASLYELRFDQHLNPVAWLINDTSRISITGKPEQNNTFDYSIEGSEASSKMKDYLVSFTNGLSRYLDLEKQILTGGTDSILIRMENERTKVADSLKKLTLDAIRNAKNPALGMFELGYYQSSANNPDLRFKGLTNREVSQLVNDLAFEFPSHQGIVTIKTSLDAQMKKLVNWEGQMAPEIQLNDVNGKKVSLSSFRGKYVFVDFWASWCPPCRKENPNLVRVWEKYRGKNFEILGVSFDKPGEKSEWLKAIRDDNLTWTHVSDLLYWSSPIVPLYRINVIPYNVLLDPGGMVIAESIQAAELDEILSGIVK